MSSIRIVFGEFSGIDQSAEIVDIHSSKDACNVETAAGVLRRASGYAPYVAELLLSGARTLMSYHRKEGGAYRDILLATTDDSVYVCDSGCWWMYGTGFTSGDYSYINYKQNGADILIMANGADCPMCFTGQSLFFLSNTPRFKNITLHFERMWGCGIDGEPDRVYYSKAFAPEDFTGEDSGFIDIPTFDGGEVVAVQAVLNDILVFKEQNIFRIFGTYPGAFEVSRVYGVTGPIAAKSIVSAAERVFFLSAEGLCVYDGVKAAAFGPDRLKDVFSAMHRDYAKNARACIHRDKLYLALPLNGSSVNNAVVEYDMRRDVFLLKQGFNVESFLPFGDRLLFTDGTSAVYAYGEGDSFNGQPINAWWETPYIDLNRKDQRKTVQRLYAYASGEGLAVTIFTDGKERAPMETPLVQAMSRIRMRFNHKCFRFKLRFSNTQGGRFTLVRPELYIETDGR